jgi:FKBP-type peptidyl-prolyl cis-trans isomerase FkpA
MRFISAVMLGGLFLLGSCLSEPDDTFSKRLDKDIATIDSYLAANGVLDAIKDVSGVRYRIVGSVGTGYTPRITDQVTFDYTGKLIDGTIFQSSTLTDASISNLIAGFQIGLTQIPAGSIATLYIPSGYGYGGQAQSNIPANSILIFEIKLRKIKVTTAELNQLGADTVAIDEMLTNKGITNIVKDTTGLRYTIAPLGTGITPGWFNRIKINYTGYLFDANASNGKGAQFYTGSNEPNKDVDSRVVNFIRGFQFGLMKLPEGSKATLYIPSGMAFGTQPISGGTVPVPANSKLIYEIELVEVYDPNP